jgi:hypothetical protein
MLGKHYKQAFVGAFQIISQLSFSYQPNIPNCGKLRYWQVSWVTKN